MKKIFNNKLTIILAILLAITLIISIILFNKTNLLKIEKEKIEQLTTSGTEFISTTQHLEEMEQASQAPKNIKRITLPNSSSINVKNYTDQWAKLTNNNFIVVPQVYTQTPAVATLGTFSHNNGNNMNIFDVVSPSVSTSYNNKTGILTVSVNNGSCQIQIVSGGIEQGRIKVTLYAKIQNVYMYLSE